MITNILHTARDYLNKGNHAEAESLCQQALNIEPNNSEALKLSGILAMSGENFTRAIKVFTQIVSLEPLNAVNYYNLGLACINIGESASAVQYFQKSIEINSKII